jgi:hypothetical protein
MISASAAKAVGDGCAAIKASSSASRAASSSAVKGTTSPSDVMKSTHVLFPILSVVLMLYCHSQIRLELYRGQCLLDADP